MRGYPLSSLFEQKQIVHTLIHRDFPVLSIKSTIQEAIALFARFQADIIAVIDDEQKWVGMLRAGKLLSFVFSSLESDSAQYFNQQSISPFAESSHLMIHEEDSLNDILDFMIKQGVPEGVCVDDQGRFLGVIYWHEVAKHILELMTEKYRETEELKATLEAIVENSYEGLVVINNENQVVMMNQFYLEVAGLKREDVVGKPILEVSPNSRLPETVRTGLPELVAPWEVNGHEFVIMRVPIRREGKIIGAIGKTLFKDMGLARFFAQKLNQLEQELEYYKKELKTHTAHFTFENIIGVSPKILEAKQLAQRASRTNSTVLITGESGTGKEVFAQAIHYSGLRKDGPFIKVNCAAIPESLLESELFGYADGAFTGAQKGGKPGKFELADRGTIFLDEIGDMSLSMQAKLLRVLQEREIERIGATKTKKIDVRVIAATHHDLLERVRKNEFRLDLFYRLNVMTIELPPLRERIEDIEPLVKDLIKRINQRLETSVLGVSPEAMTLLRNYAWPGNIRELANVLERAINISDEHWIYPEQLSSLYHTKFAGTIKTRTKTLKESLEEAEKGIILATLNKTKGNKVQAAEILGIHRSALYKKLARFRIEMSPIGEADVSIGRQRS